MKTFIMSMFAFIVLTTTTFCHADTNKELDCLTSNIYYEAGNEPEEGKVAVGLVTLNRSTNEKFPDTICGVVRQRMTKYISNTVVIQRVSYDAVGRKKLVTEKHTVWKPITICQFSWNCESYHRTHKINPSRWQECQRVAQALLDGEYWDFRLKYTDVLYFHEHRVRPAWARQKQRMHRIGGHIFYADYKPSNMLSMIQ
jgi:spore germination cell wall hydrolase CwlJ-like protein